MRVVVAQVSKRSQAGQEGATVHFHDDEGVILGSVYVSRYGWGEQFRVSLDFPSAESGRISPANGIFQIADPEAETPNA